MESFVYDATAVRNWASRVDDLIGGSGSGSNGLSISQCTKKFNETLEQLVRPNVWNGEGAKENYKWFIKATNSLVSLMNAFVSTFSQTTGEYAKKVQQLEKMTLGLDSNIANTFGSLNAQQLAKLSEVNVRDDCVQYNYKVLDSILNSLKVIISQVELVKNDILNVIDQIGEGSNFWTGDFANDFRVQLRSVLLSGMGDVDNNLNTCINNIEYAIALSKSVANGTGGIQGAVSSAKNVVSSLGATASIGISEAIDNTKSAASGAIDTAQEAVNNLMSKVEEGTDKIKGTFDFDLGDKVSNLFDDNK